MLGVSADESFHRIVPLFRHVAYSSLPTKLPAGPTLIPRSVGAGLAPALLARNISKYPNHTSVTQ